MPNGGSFWDHELVEFQRTCHRHFVWNSFAWFIDNFICFAPDQFVFHSGAGLCHGPTSDIASSGWPVRQPSIWLEPGANKFPRCYRLGIPWPLKMIAIEAWTALAGTKLLQVSYAKRMARSIFMQDGAGNFWRQKVTLEEFRFCLIHLKAAVKCIHVVIMLSIKSCVHQKKALGLLWSLIFLLSLLTFTVAVWCCLIKRAQVWRIFQRSVSSLRAWPASQRQLDLDPAMPAAQKGKSSLSWGIF